MVYKFAGDDDVWVIVDEGTEHERMLLDLGGIHGKIYGEINFSTGQIVIAHSNTSIKSLIDGQVSENLNDPNGIIYYDTSCEGQVGDRFRQPKIIHDTFSLSEGDHTLTLYYLERGASQSNCAIYFNLAPRYRLKLHKVDNEDPDAKLPGAKFAIYSDISRKLGAKGLWETSNPSVKNVNVFTTDADGYIDVSGLVAGKTYYLREITPPTGGEYPNVSTEVITLTLSATGQPTVSSTADTVSPAEWTMATCSLSDDGEFVLNMDVKNRKLGKITAEKVWTLQIGRAHV